MRKTLKSLIYLLFVGLLFSACEDNDSPEVAEINAIFSSEKETLEVEVNDRAVDKAAAEVKSIDGVKVNINLKNIILGHDALEMVAASKLAGGEILLNGTHKDEEFTLEVSGKIVDGKLKLEVGQTITSGAVGKWFTHRMPGLEGDKIKDKRGAGLLLSNIDSDEESVDFLFGPTKPENVANFMGSILGSTSYAGALDYIDFKENGNIELQYTEYPPLDAPVNVGRFPDGVLLKEGDLKFYTKDNQIYLAVAGHLIDMLKVIIGDKIDFESLPLTPTSGYYAIPMLCSNDEYKQVGALDQGGNMVVYVDRAMMLPMMGVVESVIPEDLVYLGIKVKKIVGQVKAIMEGSNEFLLGIRLAEKEYTEGVVVEAPEK